MFVAVHPRLCPRTNGGHKLDINEDQPLRIEIELAFEPAVAALQYVWTILLYGVASLFYAFGYDGPKSDAVPIG